MTGLEFAPVDTWCFGDGTPFSGGTATQDSWGGLFPPHLPTVVGATRAAIARANGWDGRGRWDTNITSVLGDGPSDVGRLASVFPVLTVDGNPVFPMPQHLLGSESPDGRWTPTTFAVPGDMITSDLGVSRLPSIPSTEDRLKPTSRNWVTTSGLRRIMLGGLPYESEFVDERELWCVESRLGIARNEATHTAIEGALFHVDHVRPSPGVRIGVTFSGLPSDWNLPADEVVPLGGEGRMACVSGWDTDPLDVSADSTSQRVVAVLLTPAAIGRDGLLGLEAIEGAPDYRVVSAVVTGTTHIGGWDSGQRRSLPLRSFVPSGSVLFLEATDEDNGAERANPLTRLGHDTHLGFGVIAVGPWPQGINLEERS